MKTKKYENETIDYYELYTYVCEPTSTQCHGAPWLALA